MNADFTPVPTKCLFPCSGSTSAIQFSDAFSHCLLERLGSGTELVRRDTAWRSPEGLRRIWLRVRVGTTNPARLQPCVRPPDGARSAGGPGTLIRNTCQQPPANPRFAQVLTALRTAEWKRNEKINYNSHVSHAYLNSSPHFQEKIWFLLPRLPSSLGWQPRRTEAREL